MSSKKAMKGKQDAQTSEQTRRSILTAAAWEFSQRGFSATSLREIARQAQTTHGLIRHHFGCKQELWCAVVNEYVAKMAQQHQPLIDQYGQADPVELLKGLVSSFILLSAQHPGASRILLLDCGRDGPHLDYLYNKILPLHEAITPVFEGVQQQGLLNQFDEDTFFIFLLNLGAFPFAMENFTNRFYHTNISSPEGITRHIQLVLATLFTQK
jgi:AcrR family transcriptional regulator